MKPILISITLFWLAVDSVCNRSGCGTARTERTFGKREARKTRGPRGRPRRSTQRHLCAGEGAVCHERRRCWRLPRALAEQSGGSTNRHLCREARPSHCSTSHLRKPLVMENSSPEC